MAPTQICDQLKQEHYAFNNLQLGNHLVALLEPCNGVVYELVHDCLGGLLLVTYSRGLTHEEGAELVEGVVNIDFGGIVVAAALAAAFTVTRVHELLEVGLVGDDTLGCELLDLLLALRLPVLNVRVLAYTKGATGKDKSLDVVVVASGAHSFLVRLGGTGLISEDETGSNPDGTGTHHEGSSQKLTVVDTTGGDDLNGALEERALGVLAEVDDGGDENGGRDVTSVTATLTTLGADNVDAEVEALLDVLGVSDHVHVDDAGSVESVDDVLGRDTDSRDEELGARFDDDVDELVELALGVIVAKAREISLG